MDNAQGVNPKLQAQLHTGPPPQNGWLFLFSSWAVGPAKKPLIYPEIDISEILHPQSKKTHLQVRATKTQVKTFQLNKTEIQNRPEQIGRRNLSKIINQWEGILKIVDPYFPQLASN